MKNIPKAHQLFKAMIAEQILYIKGSFLKEVYPDDVFESEALYPVQIESIWVNDTVNLTFCEGDSFIDTIESVDFDNVFMTK